ncbi:hypothetical protein [Demequina soli]|uniref:hypothetical protein n=1 Tax=Demequina soli TaxID=1638987 RepID=UPI0007803B9C|nr:hypothetical protein [Demequina soli]
MNSRDADVIAGLRCRLERAMAAFGVEVVIDAREMPATGARTMPALHFRAVGTDVEVFLFVEDALLIWVEVRGRGWRSSELADFRGDWLDTDEGRNWLVDLVAGRWTVQRRPRLAGRRQLRTVGGGPGLRVKPAAPRVGLDLS